MKIIKDEKLIKRNSRIGQWTSGIGFLILGGGLYIYITKPLEPQRIAYYTVFLVLGFILSQLGIYFGNRFGRSPRPDESLDASLKGLPGDFTIYHYMIPAPRFLMKSTSHLLVGPTGIWVLMTYRQRGVITYTKNRWHIGNGGFMQAYMSLFGQEGLGNPEWDAGSEINSVKKYLAKSMAENEIPPIQAVLIFMNDGMEIQAEDAPLPALKLKQLKDFMRKKAKEKAINQTQLAAIKSALPE